MEEEIKAMDNRTLYNAFCASLLYPAPGMTSYARRDYLIAMEFKKRLIEIEFLPHETPTSEVKG